MARFFEGGKEGIQKAYESNLASHRIPKIIKNTAKGAVKDTVKQTNREAIARASKELYGNTGSTRDANISKAFQITGQAWLNTINSKPQELSGSLNKPSAPSRGAFSFSGQFGGVAQQARDTHDAFVNFDLNDIASWHELGIRRAKGESEVHKGMQYAYLSGGFDDLEHRRIIEACEDILGGKAIESFLDFGNISTEADYAAAEERYNIYKSYMDRYFVQRSVYNSDASEFQTYYVIRSDAPLPPWIQATTQNIKEWEYYRGFQSETGNILHEQAMALWHEQEEYREHGYKSAFNFQGKTELTGDIDSFADVVFASLGSEGNKGKAFLQNYKNYIRDYHINPLLSGKYGTVFGNHLWNLMDTMDFAARGVRAFVAGGQELGGVKETGHTFEGQEEYWIKLDGMFDDDAKRAQKLFVDNGGYDLLLRQNGDKLGYANDKTDEEIIAQLQEAFDSNILLKKQGITWELVRDAINEQYFNRGVTGVQDDLSRAFGNIKRTYTDPTASFYADTGSTAANMLLETVLDPGLIIGGGAKSAARSSADDITRLALKDVLKDVSQLSDVELADALKSKPVKKAIASFAGSNEGRNILFKNSKKLEADAHALSKVFREAGILDDTSESFFRQGMLNALTGRQVEINGKVIGAQAFKEIRDSRRIAKTAAYVDFAVDTIDMAIIKGSFIEPFAIAKLLKGGRRGLTQLRIVRNIIAENKLKASDAANAIVDEARSTGSLGSLKTYARKVEDNLIAERDVQEHIRVLKNQFTTAASRIENVQAELGSKPLDESLREVSDILQEITGSCDNTITSIDTLVKDLKKTYSIGGDLDDVFNSLKRSYRSFTDAIERQDGIIRSDFFREMRDIQSADELSILINKYSDKLNIREIRLAILDNIPNKRIISEADLDKIIDDLSSGLLSERSIGADDIIKAEKSLPNAATTSHRVSTVSSEVSSALEKLPHLSKALADYENYPFLSSLAAKLAQITDMPVEAAADATFSTKRILQEITNAHTAVSEGRTLKNIPFNRQELKEISNELLDLKVRLEKTIDVTNAEIISTYHIDKQVKYDTLINNKKFSVLFDKFYDSMFKPAADIFDSKRMQGTDAFGNSNIYKNLTAIIDLRYAYRRHRRFINDINRLNIPDEAKYAVRNGLFGSYGDSSKKLIEVTRQPGKVRKWLNSMMYNEFSSSQVGMDTLTAKLKSIDSSNPDSIIADYVDEIKSNPVLNDWYNSLIHGDPADPSVYLQKQVLCTILLDPKAIARYNGYDKAPIFVHVSTTGLSDDSAITGISYYKWQHIDVDESGKPTIQGIYDALHSQDSSNTILRAMGDDEIAKLDEDVLFGIYKDSLGDRSSDISKLRAKYKETFGVTDKHAINSESDILEQFFSEIYSDTYEINKHGLLRQKSFNTVVPTFVVHDLDGFNIPFINQRAAHYASDYFPRTLDYSRRLSGRVANNCSNTFYDLRSIVNDKMLSEEELRTVEGYINEFAEDLSTNMSRDFSMLDIESVPDRMDAIFNELNVLKPTAEEDDVIKALRSAYGSQNTIDVISGARKVISDLELLDDEANQIATLNSSSRVSASGNLGNTVRNASQATGGRMLNIDDRYNIRNIKRFFSLGDIDNGIQETYHNLAKMSDIARYVDEKLRYSTRLGAEAYLISKKNTFDNLIRAVVTLAESAPVTDGYFSYLRHLQIPQTATESYLICQKLYDDLLKYWLNKALVRDYEIYRAYGKASDNLRAGLRERLLAEFVDELNVKSMLRTKKNSFGDVMYTKLKMSSKEYHDMLMLFEGEGQSNIFKDVPIEYLSKFDTYTSHGKMSDGIELARKLKRGYTQMQGIIQEQEYLDSLLRSSGITTKADFELGLMFKHTAEFMDLTKDGALFANKSVRAAMQRISDLHIMRVHNLRMKRLMVNNKFSQEKVFAELLYNNANHILFQKNYFRDYEIKKIRTFVKKLNKQGIDYIKIAEDRGAISIYLTNKCEVCKAFENGREVRYFHNLTDNTYSGHYLKPELEHIELPTQKELLKLGTIEDGIPEDTRVWFWESYNKLRECWADVSLMSNGASNGTLGRVVFDKDMDEYYKVAETLMPDLLSNKGMRTAHMYGQVMYDPGFMLQGNYDIVTDFFHTMEVQAENFKASGALINNVFGAGNEFNFGELTKYVSDKDLVGFFNDNSDFVVCSLVPAKDTKTGLQVKQLKLNTVSDVAIAKQLSNTAVLPYDTYLDMVSAINVKEYPSDLNRAINKLMLVYKAGSLFHPGTWVRNFIDATQKATTDLGQSPLGVFDTFFYELKCMRDIYNYQKLLRYGDDFLTEANWNTVRHVMGSDMSYENFELLRGMFDSNRYVSKAQWRGDFNRFKAGGREVISGDKVGLNNLNERDITAAYKQTVKHKKINMDKNRFIELYTGKAKPANDIEEELYNESMRTISNYLHSARAIPSLSNAVNVSFIPFNLGEMTVRYAQMSRLNDLGFSNNQALRRVHLTQFKQADHYGLPNKLEYIVPFITFKYNNLKYWMRMMDENPSYFKYFEKLYGNIAEYTAEQYQEKGQQLDFESSWMLKSGGIPIGNGNYYFKINPSFFDAIQTMYGLPSELVSNQNPLLRLASRASMYELGLSAKYMFNTLDLKPKDVNQDLNTIFSDIAPRLSKIQDLDKLSVSKFMTWTDDLGPDMDTLYKLVPSLIGKNYFNDYNSSTFEDYQAALAKDGLWYDCNTGEIRNLSEKNEIGMNAPSQGTEGIDPGVHPISWMDINNYMMTHFNKIWDANVGKFVPFWEQTAGGLNQNFDFVNDPEAWDKLCDEMLKRKGKKFDYNTKKFIPKEQWRPTGLNNPNLSFEERVELMAEKFPNLKWDANQSTFVESKDYISGGLNDELDFRDVVIYRYALFGQVYNKETHHFEDAEDPKVVKLENLYQLKDYDNYYAMLGISRLANVTSPIHFDKNGLLVTEDGRYVLLSDESYNRRLFNQVRNEYNDLLNGSHGRTYRSYQGFKKHVYQTFNANKNPYKGRTLPSHYYTGYGWNDTDGYYRFNFQYNFRYHNPHPASKLNRLLSPRINYPYGGGYNKYSFYTH